MNFDFSLIRKIYLVLVLFLCTSVVEKNDLEIKKNRPAIVDHWFFIQPIRTDGLPKDPKLKTDRAIVHNNEAFGIGVAFASLKSNLKIQAKLVVPSKPENFPCRTCAADEIKIMPDGRTILVNHSITSRTESYAFYWGIGPEDPRGKYKMSLMLEDIEIETYEFEVK